MKNVIIYTDGACSGNPGKGGYCAILLYRDVKKIVSGGEEQTTNNRMELLAVIKGLSALKERCKVELYSDSQYVVGAINNGWIYQWQNNNWRTLGKSDVKNVDLWQELLTLLKQHEVEFIKVKGHSEDVLNNECDKIAVREIKKI